MFVEHKEAVEITEAPAKVLKLSEAMRIGAKIRPQTKHFWHKDGKSCALGAAYEAMAGRPSSSGTDFRDHKKMNEWFPCMPSMQTKIHERNDDLGWTREQIADWLESQGL